MYQPRGCLPPNAQSSSNLRAELREAAALKSVALPSDVASGAGVEAAGATRRSRIAAVGCRPDSAGWPVEALELKADWPWPVFATSAASASSVASATENTTK